MLKVKDLSFSYGSIQTLNSVDMEIETGKVTCILGRNGVGKTTLLKNIMGVLRSSSGSIRQDDIYLTHLPPHIRASGLAREKTWLAVILFLITGGVWGLAWQARQFQVLNAWLGRKESSFLKWYSVPVAVFVLGWVLVTVVFGVEPGGLFSIGMVKLLLYLTPPTFGVYHVFLHYSTARAVLDVQQEMGFSVSSGLPRKIVILSALCLGFVSRIILQLEIDALFDKMPVGEKDTAGLGYVPQGRQIFPRITVEENLKVALQGRRDGRRVVPEYVYELFPVLKEMGGRMGGDLSGGQQQQLAIARALAGDPEILVLDEPTEGIQPNIIQQIGEVLRQLVAERGMTVVLVEQYLDFVKEFGEDFYVLNRGRVVANGTTAELSADIVRKHLSV